MLDAIVFLRYIKQPFVPGTKADSNKLPSSKVVLAPVFTVNISDSTLSTTKTLLCGFADKDNATLNGPGFVDTAFVLDVSVNVGLISAISKLL
jgi:hypothetical protein